MYILLTYNLLCSRKYTYVLYIRHWRPRRVHNRDRPIFYVDNWLCSSRFHHNLHRQAKSFVARFRIYCTNSTTWQTCFCIRRHMDCVKPFIRWQVLFNHINYYSHSSRDYQQHQQLIWISNGNIKHMYAMCA